MPKYMLLLYAATETSREEAEQRESEMPLWIQYYENLRDAGLLVHTDRLHSEEAATTVRVWDNETEITDGTICHHQGVPSRLLRAAVSRPRPGA